MESALEFYVIPILLAYLLAYILHRFSPWIVRRAMRMGDMAPRSWRISRERQRTLRDLLASTLSAAGFVLASLFALGRFVDADTLVWMIGLLSAGFGFGARPLISDFLTGISFIFDDEFDVGDKIEIVIPGNVSVEGVVEKIRLRSTMLRARSGEIYFIPNGEIRVLRNFSRGLFSPANIKVRVPSRNVKQAVELLEALGKDAARQLPDLLEPWQVISVAETVSDRVELTLVVKARFKRAAQLRAPMLAMVLEHMAEAGIDCVNEAS